MPEIRLSKIDQKAIDELIDWMVDGARPSANSYEIIGGMCTRLVAAGVPIGRFALFIYTLHPNRIGWRYHLDAGERRGAERGADRAVLDRAIYGEPAADGDRQADLDSSKARGPHDPARLHNHRRADRRRLHRLSGAADHLHDRRDQRGELVEQGARRFHRRGGIGAGADQPAAGAHHRGLPAAGQRGLGAVCLCRAQRRRPGAERQDPSRRRRRDRGVDPVHRHCRLHRAFQRDGRAGGRGDAQRRLRPDGAGGREPWRRDPQIPRRRVFRDLPA